MVLGLGNLTTSDWKISLMVNLKLRPHVFDIRMVQFVTSQHRMVQFAATYLCWRIFDESLIVIGTPEMQIEICSRFSLLSQKIIVQRTNKVCYLDQHIILILTKNCV